MDIYLSALLLGAGGMLAMALGGVRRGSGRHGNARHGHARNGQARNGQARHGNSRHGAARQGSARGSAAGVHGASQLLAHAFWTITTPRVMFSLLIGFGATGQLLKDSLGGLLVPAAALCGGLLFERLVITPAWNFTLRFASRPALMLDSVLSDSATAVTSFNRDGEGIIAVEVDGQIVQLLARLQPDSRTTGGRIRAGQQLRIEEVDSMKNRCTVSVL
jgi:hypothetical protein